MAKVVIIGKVGVATGYVQIAFTGMNVRVNWSLFGGLSLSVSGLVDPACPGTDNRR